MRICSRRNAKAEWSVPDRDAGPREREGKGKVKPTVMDAKLLELGRANAEGNYLNGEYAEGRQEGKRQWIRLQGRRRSGMVLLKR
jgi:hypothetical protein